MASSRKYFKARRGRLFQKQGGKCYWCKCDMIDLDYTGRNGPIPDNACTLDHLRDRLDPERSRPGLFEKRWVAACRACNHKRGRDRLMSLPIEEQWKRAGHFDRMTAETQ